MLLVLDCALFDTFVCGKQCYIMYWNCLYLTTLQEQIDTVNAKGVENVREVDWIEIKTEEDYIQLEGRVKCEPEVSVLCCVFCVQVCVCVLYCTVCFVTISTLAHHIISVSACQPADVPV
jgi:hypothetical protein